MTKKQLATMSVERLKAEYPCALCSFNYSDPFQLLIATRLSAQCTDKRVNIITPPLFEAFPDAATLAASDEATVYEYIKSVSYPNNKTRSLLGAARRLVEAFGGEVPDNIDDLLTIPGVGRKTANVMLSVVWKRAAMAVDTHVFRVSERIGLTTGAKTPRQTEEELVKNIPQEQIPLAHHWLILHGRYVCKARRPDCPNCGIADWCRWYSKHS